MTIMVVLLVLIFLKLSVLIGPLQSSAVAQIPDSGAQRNALLAGQKELQKTADSLLQHLRTQVIKVKVVSTDKESEATSQRAPAAPRK
jgi:hypothetical protein